MNQGVVDYEGHWHPIFSTGHDGIDDNEWFSSKVIELKKSLGFDTRPVETQVHADEYDAIKKVFGDDWYKEEDPYEDPRVKELTEVIRAKYATFRRERNKLKEELQRRNDDLFMAALERDREAERPVEVGLLDREHIKETCEIFCHNYKGDVGMMTHCLDKLSEMGYEPWCTCSDCGEQFQPWNYECFSHMIDEDYYHGDGGIGVIYGRVLCDDCMHEVECPSCYDKDLPNHNKPDQGKSDWDNYDLLACILNDWIGVCWGCADGYKTKYMESWNEDKRIWEPTELGYKYKRMSERLQDSYGLEGHDLYLELGKTAYGRSRINVICDLLQDTVGEYFDTNLTDGRLEWRAEDRSQPELVGMA